VVAPFFLAAFRAARTSVAVCSPTAVTMPAPPMARLISSRWVFKYNARQMKKMRQELQIIFVLKEVSPGHLVACHLCDK